jgi:hypothetical protein
LIVRADTPPLAGVNPVLAAAILADDREHVVALGENDHALGQGADVAVVEFGAFNVAEFVRRHGFVRSTKEPGSRVPARGRYLTATPRRAELLRTYS